MGSTRKSSGKYGQQGHCQKETDGFSGTHNEKNSGENLTHTGQCKSKKKQKISDKPTVCQ